MTEFAVLPGASAAAMPLTGRADQKLIVFIHVVTSSALKIFVYPGLLFTCHP
jgi:hypothetical protein